MVLPSPPLRASAAPPSQRRLGPLQRAGLTGRLAAGRDGGTTPPPGSFHGLTRRRSQKRKGALRCQLFRGVPCGARSLPARGGGGGGVDTAGRRPCFRNDRSGARQLLLLLVGKRRTERAMPSGQGGGGWFVRRATPPRVAGSGRRRASTGGRIAVGSSPPRRRLPPRALLQRPAHGPGRVE
jgi:hypothetical protein